MKALVPDLAMVPRFLIISAFVIPIPVSSMVKVFSSLLGRKSIFNSLVASNFEGSVRLSYRILSRACQKESMVGKLTC